ncbi:hypothetical protein LAV84_18575 [Rhizobium sp. VS19-DR104.2]|uniref:hypothetical protein n=1 Tax=unclassified Rhizobium TaxID=2613769 RepID=UPI001CC74344|nr:MULTISPECIES: hypothetical protein [unclassified Rhizobium]MBZ5761527.1 hypothetical protein [Rhizobium sp. VS19-DR96]MBZ5767475.1 hypothetical protein [Rhizobium sp. VS19-DR129.2]MBZ5775076.1 hypothetical protein [Rhizobium sp. VS19-DRK62.2]MBZ5785959.1 hypothetical protein [Rhizobium sp. VS19-DR121]MBZ5803385.1 hypothetical protein [Rhizobium sp. VS19-DR181]
MTDQQFTPPSTVFMKWKLADEGQLRIQKWSQFPFDGAMAYSVPEPIVDGPETCPICAAPFKPDDVCATDITEGTCHAACLEGSAVVDLDTGDELPDGKIATYPYSDVMDPTPVSSSGWQPIATAPKTGEEIIGRTGPQWGGFSCRWNGEVFIHVDGDDGYISYSPTEWMPMPGPGNSPVSNVSGRWLPIECADKSVDRTYNFPGMPRPISNSEEYWCRDADGRVYLATWADDGERAYWWDLEGESPVDPVEFMAHPLDPRFAIKEASDV